MRIHPPFAWLLPLAWLAACAGGASEDDTGDPEPVEVPDTVLDALVAGDTTGVPTVATFSCTVAPCTFTCQVDDGAAAACTSPWSVEGLSAGAHTVSIVATNAGGTDATPATGGWSSELGFVSVAVSWASVCAVSGDGGLYCWGGESNGLVPVGSDEEAAHPVPERIGTEQDWEGVHAGEYHMCGVRRDGSTACWGGNWGLFGDPLLAEDQYPVPTDVAHTYDRLFLGAYGGCGIDGSVATCWSEDDAPTVVPGAWADLSVADERFCGVTAAGELYCWGACDDAQCGKIDTEWVDAPERVGTASDWVSVSAGSYHTCALNTAGDLYCFGGNWSGELGTGATEDTVATPARVAPAGEWVDVEAGYQATCAVRRDGSAWCWGYAPQATLGSIASESNVRAPARIALQDAVAAVDSSDYRTCALTRQGRVACWGSNEGGALGRGVVAWEDEPVAFDGGWVDLAIHGTGGCGITTGGVLACWGAGTHVGHDGVPVDVVPTPVTADTDWTDVDTALDGFLREENLAGHTCGVRGGHLFCWGDGSSGQLGDGGTGLARTPQEAVVTGQTFTQVATGYNHTCALTATGEIYCFGGGATSGPFGLNHGQNGDGTVVLRTTPVREATASTEWVSVDASSFLTTARKSDGTAWIWGFGYGATPAQLGTDSDWTAVRSVYGRLCGIRAPGTLHCTERYRGAAPFRLGTHDDYVTVLDGDVVCAQRATGAVDCFWHDGTAFAPYAPYLPPPSGDLLVSWTRAFRHSCGLTVDGTRWCAGDRWLGSLGDGVDERLPGYITLP